MDFVAPLCRASRPRKPHGSSPDRLIAGSPQEPEELTPGIRRTLQTETTWWKVITAFRTSFRAVAVR